MESEFPRNKIGLDIWAQLLAQGGVIRAFIELAAVVVGGITPPTSSRVDCEESLAGKIGNFQSRSNSSPFVFDED
jgi:hypothetical protein